MTVILLLFLILVLLVALPVIFFLFLLPLGFGVQSVASLLTMPAQIISVARDRRRRRNHALEHATVNVLEQRFGAQQRLAGLAERDGFLILGVADPQQVLAAAREGLQRLQAGEHRLALHPRCGTTLVSGQLIAAISFIALVVATKQLSLLWVPVALGLAWLLARPISMLLQRYVTTSQDVRNLHVDTIEVEMPREPLALLLSGGRPTRFRVRTHEFAISPPTQSEPPTGTRRYRAY